MAWTAEDRRKYAPAIQEALRQGMLVRLAATIDTIDPPSKIGRPRDWSTVTMLGALWHLLLGQALHDHPRHLADVAENLLAGGTPGGGAVGQQRRAVGVPHPVGRLDHDGEGIGAGFAAHDT